MSLLFPFSFPPQLSLILVTPFPPATITHTHLSPLFSSPNSWWPIPLVSYPCPAPDLHWDQEEEGLGEAPLYPLNSPLSLLIFLGLDF